MPLLNYEHRNCAYCRGTGSVQYFTCNICGEEFIGQLATLERDIPSCFACGSTVRVRAVIRVLSAELFGKNLSLRDFPRRPDISGMGMTDWDNYAIVLPRKLNYTNTYYHREPKLDITSIDPSFEGTLDFLISSDVFEHVAPPVSGAFANAYKLLKPDGVFIFTVPYVKEGKTIEYFPDLNDYKIIRENDKYVLKNITRDGREQIFENLVFHGGPGFTLAMRTLSEPSILEEFSKAGFREIKIYDAPDFEHGIVWKRDFPFGSVPMAAKKITSGDKKKVNVMREKDSFALSEADVRSSQCPACGGQGSVFVAKPAQMCGGCRGTGSIQSGRCPACFGIGWMNSLAKETMPA